MNSNVWKSKCSLTILFLFFKGLNWLFSAIYSPDELQNNSITFPPPRQRKSPVGLLLSLLYLKHNSCHSICFGFFFGSINYPYVGSSLSVLCVHNLSDNLQFLVLVLYFLGFFWNPSSLSPNRFTVILILLLAASNTAYSFASKWLASLYSLLKSAKFVSS